MKISSSDNILSVLGRGLRDEICISSPARARSRRTRTTSATRVLDTEDPFEGSRAVVEATNAHSVVPVGRCALVWDDYFSTTALDDDTPSRKQRLLHDLGRCPYCVVFTSPTKVCEPNVMYYLLGCAAISQTCFMPTDGSGYATHLSCIG